MRPNRSFNRSVGVETELAGFEPTEFFVVGQPNQKQPDVMHRHSRWTFKSPLPLTSPVEDHLHALLSALEPHAAGIGAVLSRFPAEIGCAVYFRRFTAGFNLPQPLLARVAALGLDIDFDLYFLGDDEESDDDA